MVKHFQALILHLREGKWWYVDSRVAWHASASSGNASWLQCGYDD
jgi:hypothetical protein